MSRSTAPRWLALSLISLLVACSGSGGEPSTDFDVAAVDLGNDEPDAADPPDVGIDTEPDVDVEPEFTPEELVCRPCEIAAACGEGNYCLEGYPGDSSFCSADCTADASICPAETTCTDIAAGGLQRACVPDDLLACPCAGVECEEPQYCDPYQGACDDRPGLCEPCEGAGQCGEGNFCLEYQVEGGRIERGCATDCSAVPCPDGFECLGVNVGADEPARLCIPETRTCEDRCSDVTCEDPQFCDPLTGDCIDPAPYCESCAADWQCGAGNQCVGLQGAECEDSTDCPGDGQCTADGVCISFHCSVPCDPTVADLEQCPSEGACFRTSDGGGVCLPYRLTCEDFCDGVECEDGFTCDDRTGECVESLYGACDECPTNAECGGYNDLCVAIDGRTTRCLNGCGEGLDPCPVGYDCFELFRDLSFCVPQNFDGECADCIDISCPQGEQCLPVDGSCLPEPAACTSEDGDECGLAEVCNTFEGRCEPIGVACENEHRFLQCALFSAACTAPAVGLPGTCEPSCFSDVGCGLDRPYCRNFHQSTNRICTADAAGGAHTCGVLADANVAWGQPCVVVDDPTDPALCPNTATDLCLQGADPNVPGICTAECTSDEDCPGGRCGDLDGTGQYCIPDDCACLERPDLPEGEVDVLGDLLANLGTTRCGLAWSIVERRTLYGVLDIEDAYRVPLVTPLQGSPLDASSALRAEQDALTVAVDWRSRLSTAVETAATVWDVSAVAARTYPTDPAGGALAFALSDVLSDLGGEPLSADVVETLNAYDDQLEGELAAMVLSLRDLVVFHRDRFAPAVRELYDGDPIEVAQLFFPGATALDWADPDLQRLLGSRGLHEQVATLGNLTAATLAAAPTCSDCLPPGELRIETDAGTIVFAGSGDDVHADDVPPLLLVDTGGNDVYRGAAGANGGIERPASIVVDVSGADQYVYDAVPAEGDAGRLESDGTGRAEPELIGDGAVSLSVTPRQGAGVFGVGALVDLGDGADTYRSLRFSQGFGLVGVGLLVDESGDVEMRMEAGGQGAGLGGLGVVLIGDTGGRLTADHGAQGFGAPGGIGVLVGGTGNDSYTLDPSLSGDVLYFDHVTRTADALSAGQGAGVGVAAAGARGVSGGVGLFVDRGGDDLYDAGVAAQGAGFWHGAGFFLDVDGDDTYTGSSLVLGAGEKLGVGVFEDRSGEDVYGLPDEREARSAAGSAQDLAVGVFIDRAGNDQHAHSFRSMGFGQLNGFGLFLDVDGDDEYVADANESMGGAVLTILGSEPASNPRRELGTFGFFLDTGGRDSYLRPDLLNPPIGDERDWIQTSRDEAALPTYGGGFDGVGATGL